MSEADVVYSDVKFKKPRENAKRAVSSSAETTYSEVTFSKGQPSPELTAASPHQAGSKVTPERVAVVVLSLLLAAALIALGFTFNEKSQTKESLQKMTIEHKALKRNITETQGQEKSCKPVQCTCPTVPTGESCLKCAAGWEQQGGKCYYFSNAASTWQRSRDQCLNIRGDLVKIDSREEQESLELKLRAKMNYPEDKFWIGLTDSEEEGTWLWTDGSRLDTSLTFWSPGEPDDWKGQDNDGEDCVRMGEKAGAHDLKCWFDRSCKQDQRYICEKAAETGRSQCVFGSS